MTRALAYCAFQEREGMTLPETGVQGAAVRELTNGRLRVLWSEVEWPFEPSGLQKNAVEFHQVISHVFAHTAVAPFRLLTVFDDRESLERFVAERARHFSADLERLRDFVQMECVLYMISERTRAGADLSAADIERREHLLRTIRRLAAQVKDALAGISPDVRIREVKSGCRIFVLVRRGTEARFRAIAESVLLPERISRRTSGPRPASEFLSETVRA